MSVQDLLASRPRLPRHTIRLRLTLLYGGLFLASGTGLVIITYVLVAHRLPPFVTVDHASAAGAGAATGPGTMIGGPRAAACAPVRPGPVTPAQLAQCAQQAKATLARQRAAELTQLLTTSGMALAIMTVISIGLGWLVAGRVLRPLRTITTAAQRLSASSLHQRLALTGPDDELKELGDTFDGLLARLEASFAAQRQFVANASHELRTPLARQRAVVEVALADPERTVGSLSHACRRVLAAGEQQERLIEALLTLARSQRGLGRREPVDLAGITGDAVRSRLAEAGRRGLTLHADLGPAAALGDAPLAERLAANLLDNAVAHNTPGGWVRVRTGSRDGHAVLSVANSGPVIAPAQLGRLFEPFQRLGADRTGGHDGLGLGLSIVRAIADAHQATLRARALPAGGLDVQIRFPVMPAADRPVTEPPRRQAVAAGTR